MKFLELLKIKFRSSSIKTKLKILNNLRSSKEIFVKNSNQEILFLKIYYSYLFYCIFLDYDNFYMTFHGIYVNNFCQRFLDWYKYFYEIVYGIYLRLNPPKHPVPYHSKLIFGCIYKPIHKKITKVPNKDEFCHFLWINHLIIIDEFAESSNTIYHIAIKKQGH